MEALSATVVNLQPAHTPNIVSTTAVLPAECLTLKHSEYPSMLAQNLSSLLSPPFNSTTSGGHSPVVEAGLADVTLACQGEFFQAHKVVLAACSPHFKALLEFNPCQHPIIILDQSKSLHVRKLIDFIYSGEVNLPQEEISEFLRIGQALKVVGLNSFENLIQQPPTLPTHPPPQLQQPSGVVEVTAGPTTCPGTSTNGNSQCPVGHVSSQHQVIESSLTTDTSSKQEDQNVEEEMTELGELSKSLLLEDKDGAESVLWGELSLHLATTAAEMACWQHDTPAALQDPQHTMLTPINLLDQDLLGLPILSEMPKHTLGPADLCTTMPISTQPLICEYCAEIFYDKKSFQQHLRKHKKTTSTTTEHVCRICSKSFKQKCDLKRHKQAVHTQISVPLECSFCHKFLKHKQSLDSHMRDYHTGKHVGQVMTCLICNKAFTLKGKLLRHIKNVHNCDDKLRTKTGAETTYPCLTCGNIFKHKDSLRHHTRQFHSETANSNTCKLCDKTYRWRSDLKKHEKKAHFMKVLTQL